MRRPLRASLKQIVDDPSTPQGRAFDLAVQAAIVVWLFVFSLDTLPNLSAAARAWLNGLELALTLLFTAEYLLRIVAADNRLRFIVSFWGIIDLLAILPFYLALSPSWMSLRAFRLLRLFRVLKLARYSRALQTLHRAWKMAREELFMFLFAAMILIYIAAAGIYHFEHEAQPDKFRSIFESLWWAVATLTTVGYGDVYPITTGGRVFTFAILMIGLGIVAVPAGLVTSALIKARATEEKPTSSDAGESI